LGLLILGIAYWIAGTRTFDTKVGLLMMPVIVIVVLLHRQAAGAILLFLLPFGAVAISEGVGLFRWATVIVVGIWILAVLLLEPVGLLKLELSDGLVLLFCAVSSASVFMIGPRSEAPSFLGAYASAFGVYFVVSRCVTSTKEGRIAFGALCIGLGLAGAIAVLIPGAASSRQANGLIRLGTVGTIGDPTAGIDHFGGQLVVAVVLAWTAFTRPRSPMTVLVRAASVFAFLAFVATYSRAAAVGLVVAALVWAVLYPRSSRLTRVLIGVALLIVAITFAPAGLKERFRSLQQGHQEALSRAAIWEGGLKMFAAHPFLGVGVGNYPAQLPAYLGGHSLSSTEQDAHSILVAGVAEMGVFGLLMVLGLLGRSVFEGLEWTRVARPTSGARASPSAELEEWRVLAAGAFVAFVAYLAVAATLDLSRDRFLFAIVGLVHGTFRLGKRLQDG
jgi:O-antigen ligase